MRRRSTAALLTLGLLLYLLSLSPVAQVRAQPQDASDPTPNPAAKPTASASVGINLAAPEDWNTELPFNNVFRMARPWISQQAGAAWGQGPPLDLDADGYPTRLPRGVYAETPLCTTDGQYPQGTYVVLYEGTGRVDLHEARVLDRQPGRITFAADPKRHDQFWLRLMDTDPDDPVRNLRVLLPGTEATAEQQPFRQGFLDRWRGVSTIRFMDWMHTNGSAIQTWDDRPTRDTATWSDKGVPLDVMIQLAHELDADPWFCIPHRADDDYVRRFAEQVRDTLDPGRKAYVEWSNETWNAGFEQHDYAAEQGLALEIGEQPWDAAWHYTARRSVEVFDIFEDVFGGTDRLVRVLPAMAANAYVARQIAGFEDAHQHADALAIAPYLSFNIHDGDERLQPKDVETWSVDRAFDFLEQTVLPETAQHIAGHRATADRFGLDLIAYEAGQHMVAIGAANQNQKLVDLTHAANRHPRMADLYRRYLDAWQDNGGGVIALFNSTQRPNQWGAWGLLETYDQPRDQAPKYDAVATWAERNGQPIGVDTPARP